MARRPALCDRRVDVPDREQRELILGVSRRLGPVAAQLLVLLAIEQQRLAVGDSKRRPSRCALTTSGTYLRYGTLLEETSSRFTMRP